MKEHSLDYLDDQPDHRRAQLINRDKADDIARSEFWPDIAKAHGVRLAALVFKVAVKTHKKHREGARLHKSGWAAPASQWAKWIGLAERKQVYRLLREAQKRRLLQWRKVGTGLLVWLGRTSLFERIKVDGHGRFFSYGDTRYYNHHDHGLSLAAGMILDNVRYYHEHGDNYGNAGVRRNAEGWRRVFPFLTLDSIDKALHVLRRWPQKPGAKHARLAKGRKGLIYLDEEGIWRLNAELYTKFIDEKPASSRRDTQVPEGTMEVPEGTTQVPEGTSKSVYQQHSNSETPASVFADAKNVSLPSPPAADDGQSRLSFSSRKQEQEQEQEEEEQEQETVTPARKQERELSILEITQLIETTARKGVRAEAGAGSSPVEVSLRGKRFKNTVRVKPLSVAEQKARESE